MSLNAITDPQVAALIELARGAVNAELAPETGEDAVVGTYNHPRPLAIQGDVKLPSLAIYRRSERRQRRTQQRLERRVVIVIDYLCRPVGIDEIGLRWPILQRVWNEIVEAFHAGKHEAVAGGAPILSVAAFTAIESDTMEVNYDFASQDQLAFPFFRGTLVVWHREKADISRLPDLRELWARYHLRGEDGIEQNPLVISLAQAPQDASDEEIEEDDVE